MASLAFALDTVQKQQRMLASIESKGTLGNIDTARLMKGTVAAGAVSGFLNDRMREVAKTIGAKTTIKGALGNLDTTRAIKEAVAAGTFDGGRLQGVGAQGTIKGLRSIDTTSMLKRNVASAGVFDAARMKEIAETIGAKSTLAGALGNLDTTRLMKDAMMAGAVPGLLSDNRMREVAKTIGAKTTIKGALGNLDTTRLIKQAGAAGAFAGTFDSERMKEIAEAIGAQATFKGALREIDLGGLAKQMRMANAGSFSAADKGLAEESDPDSEVESAFVWTLLFGWFISLSAPKRLNLLFASTGLLQAVGDQLEAVRTIDLPDAMKLHLYSAIAIIAFAWAWADKDGGS